MKAQDSLFRGAPFGIDASGLVQIFPGLSLVGAHRLMRSKGFPNFKIGRHRYTTESLLASWMSTQLKNAPPIKSFDPLEAAVIDRCAWAVSELVKQGKIAVLPVSGGALLIQDLPVNGRQTCVAAG